MDNIKEKNGSCSILASTKNPFNIKPELLGYNWGKSL